MRSLTAGEITALQSANRTPYRILEVEDAYGEYNDLTEALESGEIRSSVDRTVIEGRFRLRRSTLGGSLSPLVTDALDAGRRIRLWYAVTVAGAAAPSPEDYHLIFDGEIDRVNGGQDPVELFCRDWIGAYLADRINRDMVVSFPAGTTLQGLIESALHPTFPFDDPEIPELEVPVSPEVTISAPVELEQVPILELVRDTAQRIGWTIRPVWSDYEAKFVLRFYEPPRESEEVAWTFSPSSYRAIPNLNIDRADIRNAMTMNIPTRTTYGANVRIDVTQVHQPSVDKYGERWAKVIEADSSPITTIDMANTMITAFLSDMALPQVEAEVEVMHHPFLDIDDRITLGAWPLTHGTDQTLAIVGYTHRFGPNLERSTFQLRGKPTGGVRRWKQVTPPDITDAYRITSFDEVFRTTGGEQVTYRATCGGLVTYVLAYRVRFQQANDVLADPYSYAEDNQLEMQVLEPTVDNLQLVVDLTYDVPGRGEVDYIVLRPYHVYDNGTWVPGPAWHASLHPPPPLPPIVDTDDTETRTIAALFAAVQERGVAIATVDFGYQIGDDGAPVEGVAPTRGPGETSFVRPGTQLGALEYELIINKAFRKPIWLWARATDEDGVTSRSDPVQFGIHSKPWFKGEGPVVVGPIIFVNGENYRSASVHRTDGGGTWSVWRDSIGTVDVSAVDDDGNAGLSGAAATYEITLYDEYIADGGIVGQVAQASVSVNLTGSPATERFVRMSASAPVEDDTDGSITLQATTNTPDITTQMQYSVGGGPFSTLTTVAGASPSPAPTTATAYDLPGLPTARELTGQLDPPQYTVTVRVFSTLHTGSTEHDYRTDEFSYTTNADDV